MMSLVLPTEDLRRRLEPRLDNTRIQVWRPGAPRPPADPVDLLVLPYMIPAAELRALAELRVSVVQSQTLGYDHVAEHLPAGIAYCNAVGVHEGSTAELAVALVLAAQRGIPEAVRDADRGRWHHRRRPGLAGKRVLVVGAGGVGSELARRLAPFDAHVDLVARTPRAGVHGPADLPGLLAGADVVVIAVPLRAETRGLVDAGFLARMRDGALLVNVARGEVVDTGALVAELRRGRLRAALDVTDPEPLPPGHPLWDLPGVLITPHAGGDADAMDERIDRVVVEQVRRLRAGEPPRNVVAGSRPGRVSAGGGGGRR
ncbi:2-hydroxyacid dehydrogenase [Myceligenerans pegani]|uniref:2-hydroxyacid dehydrogenase n=1 Tax=Myceligenerans pegani TaxID=2776917 RepID=A0ABR9MXG2_9MICO|nr:2-hydroxyacid dehydrogenase [Myceligenerans sp. TRM 65318]MBE1876075.1 2-hydroxyacid dehydrogenase [Myceligenerans sp. TRM 65318]MBE3018346.1 2-hydroxyacid dehydrogenase [Myceligenerans sp. TRM 65318]